MKDENKKVKKNKHILLKIILILFIILIIVAVAGYFYIKSQNKIIANKNLNAIKDATESIEYGSSMSYETIVETFVISDELVENSTVQIEVNSNVLNPGEEYNFTQVGNNVIKIVITCNKFSFINHPITAINDVNIDVVDTKKPVLSGVQNIEITQGETIDVKANITAKDEVDGDLEVTIEGDFDTNTPGTYTLTAKAVDKNNNETIEQFTVTVKEKKVATNTSSGTTANNNSNNTSNNKTSNNGTSSSTGTSSSGTSSSSSSNSKSAKLEQARVVARQIAQSITGSTDLEKVTKAAEIVSSYYYRGVHKESGEDYNTAYGVFIKGEASCAGCTRALGMVLEMMGYSWTHANENQWTHQWVILTMDGQIGYADGQVGWAGYGTHPLAG